MLHYCVELSGDHVTSGVSLCLAGIPTALGATIWSEHFPITMDITIGHDATDDVTTTFRVTSKPIWSCDLHCLV